jgi:hypothetical protein
MARRVLDRKKLRAEATAAAKKSADKETTGLKKSRKAKAEEPAPNGKPAVVKVRKVRAKKIKIPPRMRVRWCIYDGGMKAVALFDYNQLPAAKSRLAELLEKKPSYFMQLFKELLPLPDPELVAS